MWLQQRLIADNSTLCVSACRMPHYCRHKCAILGVRVAAANSRHRHHECTILGVHVAAANARGDSSSPPSAANCQPWCWHALMASASLRPHMDATLDGCGK